LLKNKRRNIGQKNFTAEAQRRSVFCHPVRNSLRLRVFAVKFLPTFASSQPAERNMSAPLKTIAPYFQRVENNLKNLKG
jgi:hypothetical protein